MRSSTTTIGRVALQPTVGNTGVSNSFGNPTLREEQADTFTLGMVMDVTDNVTLTVDWYEIEIKDMIALENADSIYQRCLDLAFNPAGDPNAEACVLVNRDPANGAPSNVDRTFTNEGRALMSGVDVQVDWSRDLWGGQFGLNSVANINLNSITQERPSVRGGGARRLQQLLAADPVSAVRLPDILDVQLLPRAVERFTEAPVLAGAHGRVLQDQP